MEVTDDERMLLLAGLWALSITLVGDYDDQREALEDLTRKLGGNLDATYFSPARGRRQSVY